jgi:CHAT domain-containing protein
VDARGAGNGGNGGFVEISGKERLAFDGKVDLAGPFGKAGQVLFDPANISIVDKPVGGQDGQLDDNQILGADTDGGNVEFEISKMNLEGLNGDITLQASQDINLNTSLVFGPQLGRNIGFTAGRDFNGGNQNITALGQNVAISGVNLSINSIDTSGIVAVGSTSAAGNINLNAQGNITIGSTPILDVASGKTFLVSLRALSSNNNGSAGKGGNISLFSGNGNVTASGLIQSFSLSQGLASSGGNVTINALQGGVSTGPIYTFSESQNNTSASGGKVEIFARGDIAIALDTDPQNNGNSVKTLSQATGGSANKGGEISLISTGGNITAGEIQAQSQVCYIPNTCSTDHGARANGLSSSDGGNVTLTALGNIRIRGVNSISESFQGDTGKGGNVALTSQNGAVDVQKNIQTVSRADGTKAGDGGSIAIRSQGAIKIGEGGDFLSGEVGTLSASWGAASQAGNGGAVNLQSTNGSITINKATSESYVNLGGVAGTGGNISLTANEGITVNGNLNTFISPNRTEALISKSKVGGTGASISGRGGIISLIANKGVINVVGDVDTSSKIDSVGKSNSGGNITFESSKGITAETLNSGSYVNLDGEAGSGGDISLISKGDIKVDGQFNAFSNRNEALISKSEVGGNGASISGRGGTISLIANNGAIEVVGDVDSSSKIDSVGNSNNGGNITFESFKGITVETLNSSSQIVNANNILTASGTSGSGGNISLIGGGNVRAGVLNSNSASKNKNAGTGGGIALKSVNGNIDVGSVASQSQTCASVCLPGDDNHKTSLNVASSGDGGNINLDASGDIKTAQINSFSESFIGGAGKGGNITLASRNGRIDTGKVLAFSLADGSKSSDGGAVSIKSAGGIIAGPVFTTSASWADASQAAGLISILSDSGDVNTGDLNAISLSKSVAGNPIGLSSGKGGQISLGATKGNIDVGIIQSQSQVCFQADCGPEGGHSSRSKGISSDDGGDIILTASGNIKAADINSFSESFQGNTGKGGDVKLTSTTGSVTAQSITTASRSDGIKAGNGGSITVKSQGLIKTGRLETRSASWGPSSQSENGGAVDLQSSNGGIEISGVGSESFVNLDGIAGNGGSISLTANNGAIRAKDLDSRSEVALTGSSGDGGFININSKGDITTDGLLTWSRGSKSSGNAGAINLKTTSSNINLTFADAYSGSPAGASKDGGEVKLTATQGSVSVARKINSFSNGANSSGNGGDIIVNAGGNISAPEGLFSFSQFSSNPSTMRRGGNITLDSTGGGIQVGTIESFADGRSTAPTKGGAVTLTAKSDIATKEIYTGSQGSNGQGGKVTIKTSGLFQSSGIREGDVFCSGASICTAGGAGVGAIKIFHGGELRGIPFTVGTLTKNGTLGAIQTQIEDLGLNGQVRYFNEGYLSPQESIQINIPKPSMPLPKIPFLPNGSTPKISPPKLLNKQEDSSKAKIEALEQDFTNEFKECLKINGPARPKTLSEIQNLLMDAERNTGLISAIVYLNFVRNPLEKLPKIKCGTEPSDGDELEIHIVTAKHHRSLRGFIPGIEKSTYKLDDSSQDLLSINLPNYKKPPLPITYGDIKQSVNIFRRELLDTSNDKNFCKEGREPQGQGGYQEESRKLYDFLIRPIEDDLSGIKHIAFIPSAKLRALPFAAISSGCTKQTEVEVRVNNSIDLIPEPYKKSLKTLKREKVSLLEKTSELFHDNKKDFRREAFLVEKFGVSIMPSVSLSTWISESKNSSSQSIYSDLPKSGFQFMGASEFPGSNFGNLPARLEADFFTEIWRENLPQKPLLDEEFRPESLQPQNRPSHVNLIYLSTHGIFDENNPEDSYILFGQGKKVTLKDIQGLGLDKPPPAPIELMIFSACSTADGSGNSHLGFAGAATKSNVKSVIAGLYEIDVRGTFTLMSEFLEQAKNGRNSKNRGLTKAESLQRAQLSLLHRETYIANDGLLTTTYSPQAIQTREYPDFYNLQNPYKNFEFMHPGYWSGMTLIGLPW